MWPALNWRAPESAVRRSQPRKEQAFSVQQCCGLRSCSGVCGGLSSGPRGHSCGVSAAVLGKGRMPILGPSRGGLRWSESFAALDFLHLKVSLMTLDLWGGLQSIKGSCFNFSTAVYKEVTYKELKNLLKSKTITLIDVRETWEILEYGKIPGSINIPLDEVGKALQMNPRDFKDKYNEVKPSESDNLVFSCLAGVRSKKALDTAISLGFNRAQHYAGGWKEWTTYEFSNKQGS
ncbi:thiosulfate sulfurtransferase/rhodanese-like domain-containing protein 3 [Rhynchocyon petersi]